ncbi:hypothetical protein JOE09_001868 [Pantoea coffeiphila]|nr:hypothetical protein [Pantoea coffeiphila]
MDEQKLKALAAELAKGLTATSLLAAPGQMPSPQRCG